MSEQSPSPAARALRLLLALAALWFIIYVLAPIPVKSFGPMRDYVNSAQKHGIHPGALYYTDVPQSREAEMNNRDAMRYHVKANQQ